MPCSNCKSELLISVSAKCSDCCAVGFKDHLEDGYVPDLGFGSGDYIKFKVCCACGQIQNFKPLTEEEILDALGVQEEEEE